VPRTEFLIAGEAWRRTRAGEADPAKFGILDLHGAWFIAGNVVRDVAALAKRELLPWDLWGAMFGPEETPAEARLALLDRAAALTLAPDANEAELAALADTPEFRVPSAVLNVQTKRSEAVPG
jgi:hypothetical protein